MGYGGYQSWNMIILCFWVLFAGTWTSFGGFLKTWAPFTFIMAVILLFKFVL